MHLMFLIIRARQIHILREAVDLALVEDLEFWVFEDFEGVIVRFVAGFGGDGEGGGVGGRHGEGVDGCFGRRQVRIQVSKD